MSRMMFKESLRVFFIMGTGDVIAQTLVEKRELRQINVERTIKFASVGFFFVAPALRFWFNYLDRAVSKDQPPLKRGLKKMALDQIFFAPVLTVALTTIVSAINGDNAERIKERLRNDYLTIMLRNYMLWPAAQLINFSFVPMHYQVVFAQFVAVIWNTYLSMMLNTK